MSLRRLWALVMRECLELVRDRFRSVTSLGVPAILMIVLGYGLTLDVNHLSYAALDHDRTPTSRDYLETFAQSRYFELRQHVDMSSALDRDLQSGEIRLGIEIPVGFGRDLGAGRVPEVAFWIDGTMPFRADTVRGYAEAAHVAYLRRQARESRGEDLELSPVQIEPRFWYNQSLESRFAFVPGLIATIMLVCAAMFTAVAVVREKELGSIANLYASPMTRLEFVWGKQLPYAGLSLVIFGILFSLAWLLFDVPLRGSLLVLLLGAAVYSLAITGIGLLVSTFTRTQTAALLITLILTMIPSFLYSGFFVPVNSLGASVEVLARLFPAMYFLDICVGTFTKGLGLADLWANLVWLGGFFVGFSALSVMLLPRQER